MDASSPGRRLKAAAALFPAALTLALLGLSLLRNDATWWRVAYGRLISAWGRIPDRELLLFTAPENTTWVDSSWLASVALFELHDLGGVELNLVVRSALVALSVALAGYGVASRSPRPAAVLNLVWLALPAALWLSPPGPETLALPVATAALVAAMGPLSGRRLSLLPVLVVAAAPWLVLHLSVPIALTLIATSLCLAALALKQGQRLLAALAAAALLAPLSSPLGFGVLLHLLQNPALPTLAPTPLTVALALSTGLLAILLRARTGGLAPLLRTGEALPAILLTLWALSFPALIPLQHLALVMLLAPALTPPAALTLRRPNRALALAILILGAAVLTQHALPWHADLTTRLHPDARQAIPFRGVLSEHTPLACGEVLRRSGKELRVLNDPALAGYLSYALWRPERIAPLLYADTRGLSEPGFVELLNLMRDQPIARGVAQQEKINAVVLRPAHFPSAFDEFERDPTWALIAGDADQPVACFLKAAPVAPGTWAMP
ncbi:hypothetical protein DL240_04740 [Lujinxingia litoralis]|uniref:Glycosyltransferase RgtA/B/C/D-like domain-containing protein n=1 Tax=Lujinxingia litoralis TaxID=2211119 RepID=A0A328CDM4_9DELT|nr:hypothetical protein [Lujinxingia litoralis]RAL25521.1 hypothetical protein DL240_04740 [Lujinxingia litoralis]